MTFREEGEACERFSEQPEVASPPQELLAFPQGCQSKQVVELEKHSGPGGKNFVEWPTESEDSSAGAGQMRRYSGSSSNLLESHVNTLEPQPGEQQHYHHVGEGKSKPRGEVHGIFAVRKQSGGRNTGPHLYQTLSHGPHETV